MSGTMQLLPGISVLMMVVVVPPELLLLPGNRFAVGEQQEVYDGHLESTRSESTHLPREELLVPSAG